MKVQTEEVHIMTPHSLECGCQHFRETHCLGFQDNGMQYLLFLKGTRVKYGAQTEYA